MNPDRDEKLRQLRRVVEAAPPDRFEMIAFCTQKHGCGTAYCAAGHAALDPWFRKHTPILKIFDVQVVGNFGVHVSARDDFAFERLAELFGISFDDADRLFGGELNQEHEGRVTKEQVIANIDRLLAGEEPEYYSWPTA